MKTHNKNYYACDFETSVENEKTWVWSFGVSKLYQNKVDIGTSIEEFMNWALDGKSKTLYFHNLKFDGKFIMYYLLSNGYKQVKEYPKQKEFSALVDDMGNFYSMRIPYIYKNRNRYCTILDSYKLFPSSIENLAKAYDLGIEKEKMDYDKVRYSNSEISEEDKKYLQHDVIILRKVLEIGINNGFTKTTIASNALNYYKNFLLSLDVNFTDLFPEITNEQFEYMQHAYKGGCSMVNKKYRNKIVKTHSYDVNSMYPWVLREKALPIGKPIFFTGQYQKDEKYNLYIQHIKCEFYLKENSVPTIQVKNTWNFMGNEWIENSNTIIDLYLTNIDLELFFDNYDVYNLEYIDGYKFVGFQGCFNNYIDHFYDIKCNSTDKAMKNIAKLYLNSLYGKFGSKPVKKSVLFHIEDKRIKSQEIYESETKTIYLPIAIFVTSYARQKLFTNIKKVLPIFIYCDTDSIHTTEKTDLLEQDSKKLGYFKYEYSGTGKYIKQKTYIVKYDKEYIKKDENGENITTKICCAGLNQKLVDVNSVNFDDFAEGKTFEKMCAINVEGGVALVIREHKITSPIYTEHTDLYSGV